MNTEHTGIQVAPVTEDYMSKVREVFETAANSIVAASELSRVVDNLKREVEGLKADIEAVRRQNQGLDEALQTVRGQRDEAQNLVREQAGRIDNLNHTIGDLQRELDGVRSQYEQKVRDLEGVQAALYDTRHDRDVQAAAAEEWESKFHALERAKDEEELAKWAAEERATVAEGRLKAIQKAIEDQASAFLHPTPAPEAAKPEGESASHLGNVSDGGGEVYPATPADNPTTTTKEANWWERQSA